MIKISANKKDAIGSEALNPDNIISQAAKILKQAFPALGLIGDVSLDPITDHGHDGILKNDYVDDDGSVKILTQQALLLVKAVIDIVAPSDMMDGRVAAIRTALDEQGMIQTRILSYVAKYASGFYGPFCDALGSGKALRNNKKTYQMNQSLLAFKRAGCDGILIYFALHTKNKP